VSTGGNCVRAYGCSRVRSSVRYCVCLCLSGREISCFNVFVLVVLGASNCHCRDTFCTPAFIAGTLLLLPIVANAYVLSMITAGAGISSSPKLSVSLRFGARSEMEFWTNNTRALMERPFISHLSRCSTAVFRLTNGRRPNHLLYSIHEYCSILLSLVHLPLSCSLRMMRYRIF
jgi:hypothetical protein